MIRLNAETLAGPRPSRRTWSLVSVGALAAGCGGAALLGVGCGSAPPSASAPVAGAGSGAASASGAASGKANAKAPKSMDPPGLVGMIGSSYLVPELSAERGVFLREEGHKKVLVDRMRLIVHDTGAEERASELLPNSYASAMVLPSRLGGGFLFQSSGGGSTHLWRAASWLGKLTPLASLSPAVDEIVAGFDRLYVRHASSNRVSALDPQSGQVVGLGPLPPSVTYGALAFADGWRAVVDTDLRGPLVTFDAGTTWRALGLRERAGTITAITGDPTLFVSGGRYVIDAAGAMRFHPDAARKAGTDRDKVEEAKTGRPPGPLGKRPLRAALEDGFPSEGRTAIVARGGALARVSLSDGSVLKLVEGAYKEREAPCHGVRVGAGFGFVCGERDGATVVYAFEKPFALKEVWRFAKPRFVSASGNGSLVARGSCSEEPERAGEGQTYCIRGVDGATQQIRVTGAPGSERVIALADGRVVVMVPPRREGGQITVLRGSGVESSAALKFPVRPQDSARAAKRGLWMEGFEEREPGVIGGWVEAGGTVVGVRVALNGEVTLGETRGDPNGAVVAGRFGVSMGDDGEAAETTDGGMSWSSFEVPDHEVEGAPRTRACGPVGCALASWMRVGWGKELVKDDFASAKVPVTPYTPMRAAATVSMACELVGSVTPPLREKPAAAAAKAPSSGYATPPYPRPYGHYGYGYGYGYKPAWAAFRNTAAPTLGKDEVGVDTGSYGDVSGMRSYAWGKKGADWTKVGKWLVRFDDRYDVGGGVRSSATTAPPWADEASAITGVGGGMTYGSLSWASYLDPSGRAVLGQACNGPCLLYAVADGQPVLPLRDASGKLGTVSRILSGSTSTSGGAVRVGESWFFLTQGSAYDQVALWRADLGVVRQIGAYYRPSKSRYSSLEPPRLVRRAAGTALGLVVTAPRGPNEAASSWYVMPVNLETGALEEPLLLGRRDLGGVMPERCAPGQDGWLMDTTLETTPSIDLGNVFAPLDGVELRLRLDPGSVCLEGVAARVEGTVVAPKAAPGAAKAKGVDARRVPLAATERGSGQRWVFQCDKPENMTLDRTPVAGGVIRGVLGGTLTSDE